jgi:hypothetical protein
VAWGIADAVRQPGCWVRDDHGTAYRVRDTAGGEGACYRDRDGRPRDVPQRATRYVSAALAPAQSRQLIAALYLLHIERVADEAARALALVLYRYMLERGYTARYVGRYAQEAQHIGNGGTFRTIRHGNRQLAHFGDDDAARAHRAAALYTERARVQPGVLNQLVDRDGLLRARGKKGNRRRDGRDRADAYLPKKRVRRTRDDEARMLA